MNLPSQIVSDILASVNSGPSAEPGDKRRALRMKVDALLPMKGVGGRGEAVQVVDLSPRGVCLLHPTALDRGEQFILRLPRQGDTPVPLLCTVVYCRPDAAEHAYRVGAEFTCVLDEEKVRLAAQRDEEIERLRQSVLS